MLTHKGTFNISCDECDSMFISKEAMVRQNGLVHYVPGVYICPTCNKECRTKGYLKAHIMKHSNIRAFICRDMGGCRKRFKTITARNAHEKLSSSAHISNYKCNSCAKFFFKETKP